MQDRKLVLIVDDTPTNVAVVSGVLKDSFKTKVATNGEKALAIAMGPETPDLILLDVMMPDMDGIATFKALQAHPETEQIPVILLTAKAQTSEKRQFNDLGVCGVITKPFNSLDLPEQIAKILHWQL